MKTLQEYLSENYKLGIVDYHIRVFAPPGEVPTFYIHPRDDKGETLDFAVSENQLVAKQEKLPVLACERPIWWCRCKLDCCDKMTEAERNEHEKTEHPGVKVRKDLDDMPIDLRRQRFA